MPEYEFVNHVELSPLILAECRVRVMRDLHEGRTSMALSYGLQALYAAAIGYPTERVYADEQLRLLAVPLAAHPSSVEWTHRAPVDRDPGLQLEVPRG